MRPLLRHPEYKRKFVARQSKSSNLSQLLTASALKFIPNLPPGEIGVQRIPDQNRNRQADRVARIRALLLANESPRNRLLAERLASGHLDARLVYLAPSSKVSPLVDRKERGASASYVTPPSASNQTGTINKVSGLDSIQLSAL